ncbi:unnamed protein product [Clavelina lepadiformis]|uniref:Proline dehydrogenase n=1 Tax=Clavelina lepadiformis TaxID=159417 RepID=A0ABP0GLW5_CLALP
MNSISFPCRVRCCSVHWLGRPIMFKEPAAKFTFFKYKKSEGLKWSNICQARPASLKCIQTEVKNNTSVARSLRHISHTGEQVTGFEKANTLSLIRAAAVLKLCSYDFVVNNGIKMFDIGIAVFGRRAFGAFMRWTFYGQFCLGTNNEEIMKTSRILNDAGLKLILCTTVEEESLNRVLDKQSEKAWFEENVKSLLDCVKKTSDVAISQGPKIMQMKLTALMKSSLCEKITQHLNKGNEDDLTEMFDACLANKFEDSPLFTADENQQVHGAMLQLLEVLSYAEKKDVYIMLDAEYTDINPTIVLVAKSLMKRFNKTKPTVQTTYQAYLKSALDDVKKDLDFCLRSNLHFGVKIVRGAYMNAERHKAAAKNREDPICEDWNSTNDNYNRVVSHILQRVSSQTKPAINVTVATHNEESVTLAIDRMIWNKIDSSSGQVTFAQIYGLSDYLSNSLAVNGFLVYKSVPIGGMEETLPYLSRRVHENNGLMKKTRKDRDLIWKELRKRFVLF